MTPAATTSREPFSDSKWSVYKDSFEPQPPPRRLRAWERAPSAAHAPRLQGQTIWKRVRGRMGAQTDKENYQDAQAELEKAGAGARKRPRTMRAKEAIGDATWVEHKHEPISVSRETHVSAQSNENAVLEQKHHKLQIVPRKRTNARSVISPKKPLQPRSSNSQARTSRTSLQSEIGGANQSMRPQKSIKKSIRRSIRNSLMVGASPITQDRQIPMIPAQNHGQEEEESLSESSNASRKGGGSNDESGLETISVDNASPGHSATLDLRAQAHEAIEPDTVVKKQETAVVENYAHGPKLYEDCKGSKDPKPASNSSTDDQAAIITSASQLSGYQSNYSNIVLPTTNLLPSSNASDNTPSQDKDSTETCATTPAQRKATQADLELRTISDKGKGTRRSTRLSTRTTPTGSERLAATKVESSEACGGLVEVSSTSQTDSSRIEADVTIAKSPLLGEEAVVSVRLDDPQDTTTGLIEEQNGSLPASIVSDSIIFDDMCVSHEIMCPGSKTSTSLCEAVPVHDTQPSAEVRPLDAEVVLLLEVDKAMPSALPVGHISKNSIRQIAPTPTLNATIFEGKIAAQSDDALNDENPLPQSILLNSPLDPDLDSEESSETDSLEGIEALEPVDVGPDGVALSLESKLLPESTAATVSDPVTTELTETISSNAPADTYDHEDDTDMLRNFLSKVKANKAAKAVSKRKRSFPHSPLRLPLGGVIDNMSPSEQKEDTYFDIRVSVASPSKRRRGDRTEAEEVISEPQSVRRSTRTRLPVVKAQLGAPSLIPVRRLGQDQDNTITIKRNDDKELATLTRLNTRKNKGGSLPALEVLAKWAAEKEDPAIRQQYLRDAFDEKSQQEERPHNKKGHNVDWAEELERFHTMESRGMAVALTDGHGEKLKMKQNLGPNKDDVEKMAKAMVSTVNDVQRKTPVRAVVRSKIALGMAMNGTPAPKRKMRGKK